MSLQPRYLKLRRQTWFFNLSVPPAVRPFFEGQPYYSGGKITRTTGERDVALAQPIALQWASEYKKQFNRLKVAAGSPRDIYRDTLGAIEAGGYSVDAEQFSDPSDPYNDPEGEVASLEADALLDQAASRKGNRGPDGYPIKLTAQERAKLDAVNDWQRKRRGEGPAERPEYGLPFSKAAERWVKANAKDWLVQTKGQYEATHRLFVGFSNDKPIRLVSSKDAAEFLDAVADLAPHWGRGRHVKEMSFEEVMEKYGDHPEGLSNKTLNRYLSALINLWEWAKARGEVTGDNPFKGHHRKISRRTSKPYTHFDDDDLRSLFKEKHAKRVLWEIPLVALYSGMRLNEICSLQWRDVKQEDGVWYFDIIASKSEAGVRVVPVHSRLMWLLDRRGNDGNEYIWPELKPGGPDGKRSWSFTSLFTTYRRAQGVTDIDRSKRYRKAFHSFRKNATRCLELARVPQTEAAEIIGHEKAGITYAVYNPEGLTMKDRRRVVEKIKYPVLRTVGQ